MTDANKPDFRRWEVIDPDTGDLLVFIHIHDLADKPWGVVANNHLKVFNTEEDAYEFALANATGLYHIVNTTERTV